MKLTDINTSTREGRLLMTALAALTVSPQVCVNGQTLNGQHVTPEDMLNRLETVQFEIAARPLIQYLAENHHPHHTAVVTSTGAELSEGKSATGQITDYLKD